MAIRYKLLARHAMVGTGVMGSQFVAVSGVAKTNNAGQPHAVANELICGKLGRALCLPIPPGFIIEDAGTPWHVSLDFNLAGQQLPPADAALLAQTHPQLAAGIIVFDSWVVNADRHPGNLAFDQTSGAVHLFDHSHAFFATNDGHLYLVNHSNQALANHNCLTPHITTVAGLTFWLDRVNQIPEFIIEEAVQSGVTVGLPAGEEQFCSDYLKHRRTILRNLLLQQQNLFTSVPPHEWAHF
jgi:hypothetical protein